MNKDKRIDERQELLNIFAPSSLSFEEACTLTDILIKEGYKRQINEEDINAIKVEAVKEFASTLEERLVESGIYPVVVMRHIKRLIEERTN